MSNFPVVHTKRLNLREITKTDAADLLKLYGDERVAKYETFKIHKTVEEAKETIKWYKDVYDKGRIITWGISLKNSPDLIGIIQCEVEVPRIRADIGYDLRPEYWNKGLTTEAVLEIIKFIFDKIGVNRIEATVSTKNTGSIKVLEKTGFIKEGILRKRSCLNGELHDMIMYSILKEEYEDNKLEG